MCITIAVKRIASPIVVHMEPSAKYPMLIIPVQAPEIVSLHAKRVIMRTMAAQHALVTMFPIAAEASATAPKSQTVSDLIVSMLFVQSLIVHRDIMSITIPAKHIAQRTAGRMEPPAMLR